MPVHTSPLHKVEVFNKALLLRQLGNDRELLRDIVNLFLESAPPLLSDIKKAVARVDSPSLFEAAHALRGSARNFYAHTVEQAALALEVMAQKGHFLDAENAYRTLEVALDELCCQLREELSRGDSAE